MIRAHRSDVEQSDYRRSLDTHVAAVPELCHRLVCRRARQTKPLRVFLERLRRGRDVEGGIVELADLPVGMAHGHEPRAHRPGQRAPPRRNGQAIRGGEIAEVEHVFERQRMVHRAALEMPAIRQNLFAQFALDDVETPSVAALGLGTVEVQARVHECLGICKQMIAQEIKQNCF